MPERDSIEQWRSVDGGCYSVSSMGRIRRDAGGRGARVGRILKTRIDDKGYEAVELADRHRSIHSLVAEAFIGPRPDGMTVNHKDLDKRNNYASNLEYLSNGDNTRHAIAAGRKRGSFVGNAKLSEAQVREMRSRGKFPGYLKAMCKDYGLCKTHVCAIMNGRIWKFIA
jgi:hypothetical protein